MDNNNQNDFNKERTEVFDKIKKTKSQFYNSKIQPINEERVPNRADETFRLPPGGDKNSGGADSQFYHLKGNEIKSSRQRLTEAPRAENPNKQSSPCNADGRQSRPASKSTVGTSGNAGRKAPPGRNTSARRGTSAQQRDMSARRGDGVNISGRRKIETKHRHFYISGVVKVILYIGFILVVAGVISYNVITIANDVFALVKEPAIKSVTIPEGADTEKIAEILAENGLISNPKIFKFWAELRKKDSGFIAGDYVLETTMNYDEFLFEFRYDKTQNNIITVTIPEGYTVDEIIDLFVSKGIGTRSRFIEVINTFKFDYKFIELLDHQILSKDRKYRLEGYLFPDTYDFYASSTEMYVIDTLLHNFNIKFEETFYSVCETIDLSVDEIITLASIVEREAANADEFRTISKVFHNRLLSPSFPFLESDATIQYSFDTHKSDLTGADLELDLPYNTYKRPGLPPSAICNPGYEAILAALYPDPDASKYMYFVHDDEGNTYFAETYDQHLANINKARANK